jgi:hypothetical protein
MDKSSLNITLLKPNFSCKISLIHFDEKPAGLESTCVKRVQVSLESGCDMVLICNHPELVEQVIERDWPVSEKLQSMRGIKPLRQWMAQPWLGHGVLCYRNKGFSYCI